MEKLDLIDLFAEEGDLALTAETLTDASLLASWGSFASFASASCPGSTASSTSSASTAS